jgi:hypothetical protein
MAILLTYVTFTHSPLERKKKKKKLIFVQALHSHEAASVHTSEKSLLNMLVARNRLAHCTTMCRELYFETSNWIGLRTIPGMSFGVLYTHLRMFHLRVLHHTTYYNKYGWKVSGDYISVRSHDGGI